jgi:hypothetical protein
MSEAYFKKVLDGAVTDVIASMSGGRNENLNKAAFSIGRHAHLAPASIDSAIMSLHAAAKQIGLDAIETKMTIGSGFKRGGENPKELENSDVGSGCADYTREHRRRAPSAAVPELARPESVYSGWRGKV